MIMFSDETSGNTSRKWNRIEVWSMKPAALSIKERNKRANNFLICAHNKMEATEMLPFIVDDLVRLERGVLMFDAATKKKVLVVAPLLLISGDNPRHAELALNKGLRSLRPYRSCYFFLPRNTEFVSWKEHRNRLRDKDDSKMILEHPSQTEAYVTIGGRNSTTSIDPDEMGVTLNGAEALMKLDAFDLTKDLPVELLHKFVLGIVKYVFGAVYNFLKPGELTQFERRINKYASKPYRRIMTSRLRWSGSFVGRDHKIMMQQLGVVVDGLLKNEWVDMVENRKQVIVVMRNTFVAQGKLASLLFVGRVYSPEFQKYRNHLKVKLARCKEAVDCFDDAIRASGAKRTGPKPKMHNLLHILLYVDRFALGVHFETESEEQFNKLIRRRLFFTNRHNISRDILESYGRFTILRHMLDDGYWVNPDVDEDTLALASGAEHMLHAGINVLSLICDNADFEKLYLGKDRDFTNNNDPVREWKKGVFAFIRCRDACALGDDLLLAEVIEMKNNILQLRKFRPLLLNVHDGNISNSDANMDDHGTQGSRANDIAMNELNASQPANATSLILDAGDEVEDFEDLPTLDSNILNLIEKDDIGKILFLFIDFFFFY
jgi:hypothetical protein